MAAAQATPEMLKQAVFELVGECREKLRAGLVDVSEVDRGVRAYCNAIQDLPREEGTRHTADLEEMMRVVTLLSEELVAARDQVRQELQSLEHMKRANMAYNKSDGVGTKYIKKEQES